MTKPNFVEDIIHSAIFTVIAAALVSWLLDYTFSNVFWPMSLGVALRNAHTYHSMIKE